MRILALSLPRISDLISTGAGNYPGPLNPLTLPTMNSGTFKLDPTRKWVKGTSYLTCEDEYSKEGTCIGVGTIEVTRNARAVGIALVCDLPPRKVETEDLFAELYGSL